MKTRPEIAKKCSELVQALLDWVEPEQATDALDALGMMMQVSAEVLAGACSVEQAVMGMDTIAQHLIRQDRPNVNVTFAVKH